MLNTTMPFIGGDLIELKTDNLGSQALAKYPLSRPKLYTVIEYNNSGTFAGVVIVNDDGKKAKYKAKYFTLFKRGKTDEEIDRLIEEAIARIKI